MTPLKSLHFLEQINTPNIWKSHDFLNYIKSHQFLEQIKATTI